jgi:hypothetical protein
MLSCEKCHIPIYSLCVASPDISWNVSFRVFWTGTFWEMSHFPGTFHGMSRVAWKRKVHQLGHLAFCPSTTETLDGSTKVPGHLMKCPARHFSKCPGSLDISRNVWDTGTFCEMSHLWKPDILWNVPALPYFFECLKYLDILRNVSFVWQLDILWNVPFPRHFVKCLGLIFVKILTSNPVHFCASHQKKKATYFVQH